MSGEIPVLGPSLSREVLRRLDCEDVRADLGGLTRVYRAWGARLGMENVSKRLRLMEGRGVVVPPEELFRGFLAHGTSGTCWSTMAAFVALLRSVGFDARPRLGEMTKEGELNHGTTVVVLGGVVYSVDQTLLWPSPLPLDRSRPTEVRGPLATASARFDPRREVFVFEQRVPGHPGFRTVLHTREATAGDYLPAWRASASGSRFNSGCFIHRAREDWRGVLDGELLREARIDGAGPAETAVRRADWARIAEELFALDGALVRRMVLAGGEGSG